MGIGDIISSPILISIYRDCRDNRKSSWVSNIVIWCTL